MTTVPEHYAARATQHRPTDPDTLRLEVLRLAADGLTCNDIAQALRLDPATVRTWLGPVAR